MEQNMMIPEQITSSAQTTQYLSSVQSLQSPPNTTMHTNELSTEKTTELLKLLQTASYAQNILQLNWINSLSSNLLQDYVESKDRNNNECVPVNDNLNQDNSVKINQGILNDDVIIKLISRLQQYQQINTINSESANNLLKITTAFDTTESVIPNDTINNNNNINNMTTWSPNKPYQLCSEERQYQEYQDNNSKLLLPEVTSSFGTLNNSHLSSVSSSKITTNANLTSYAETYNLINMNSLPNIDSSTNRMLKSDEQHLSESSRKLESTFKCENEKHFPVVQQDTPQQQQQQQQQSSKPHDVTNKKTLQWAKLGVPQPAILTKYSAPVHIDVGGTLYTSSLKALTKYPKSLLGKMFNGTIPIVLDTMKQHYFIDRDGTLFRHVLNFLRTDKVNLDPHFTEMDQLIEEANFYGLYEMTCQLKQIKGRLKRRDVSQFEQFIEEKKDQKIHADEKESQCTPRKQLKIDSLNQSHLNESYSYRSEIGDTGISYSRDYSTANSSFYQNDDEIQGDDPSKNRLMYKKYSCIMLEINISPPHQGKIILSKCNNQKLLRCFNELNAHFANILPNCFQIVECEDYSELSWFMMSSYQQLKLWELLLNHECELVTQYESKQTDKNCIIYLFQVKL